VEREVCSSTPVAWWVGGVRLGPRLSWRFSLFSSVNFCIIPQLHHEHLLPYPSHFIAYQSTLQQVQNQQGCKVHHTHTHTHTAWTDRGLGFRGYWQLETALILCIFDAWRDTLKLPTSVGTSWLLHNDNCHLAYHQPITYGISGRYVAWNVVGLSITRTAVLNSNSQFEGQNALLLQSGDTVWNRRDITEVTWQIFPWHLIAWFLGAGMSRFLYRLPKC
jgi:hypothetical protein